MSELHAAPRIETERLILRAWRQSDIEPFLAMMAEPEVARYLNSTQGPMDRIEAWRTLSFILGHWTLRGFGLFAAEEKASGAFIGRVGAWCPFGREEVELGWGVRRAYWGKGYAYEAAHIVGEWMFDVMGLQRIASFIHVDNTPSQRLAQKLKMSPGAETLHAGMPHVIWSVARSAWFAR